MNYEIGCILSTRRILLRENTGYYVIDYPNQCPSCWSTLYVIVVSNCSASGMLIFWKKLGNLPSPSVQLCSLWCSCKLALQLGGSAESPKMNRSKVAKIPSKFQFSDSEALIHRKENINAPSRMICDCERKLLSWSLRATWKVDQRSCQWNREFA